MYVFTSIYFTVSLYRHLNTASDEDLYAVNFFFGRIIMLARPGVEQAVKNWEGKIFLQLSPLFHLLAAHALFCPPVEAMHAVTRLSVDTVLTSSQIR